MKLETKFQDKDFEFGEIVQARVNTYYDENKVVVMADRARGGISRFEYNSIKDFTDHWTDAPEEPRGFKSIGTIGPSIHIEMGSEEEAEKAVKKLKAWKRLKDKGFKFNDWNIPVDGKGIIIFANYPSETRADLDLLFGGEE